MTHCGCGRPGMKVTRGFASRPARRRLRLSARSSLRSGCRSVFLFFAAVLRIVRARSTGSTVLRTAAQPMDCVGASLISSHNPSAACPAGCPGSVGHSYAMLRQQPKNNGGEGDLAGHLSRPRPPGRNTPCAKRRPASPTREQRSGGGRPLTDPQESIDNIIEIPSDCTCPFRPL